MRTLISVIIPSYNRANTVGETIESIVNQKVDADVEIIIGDDCSTDNAREVLLKYKQLYPDNIKLFFRDKNVGLGANWALCLKECKGEFICNCDNDDYWHNPKKLQIELDYMRNHPECNIAITNHRTLNRETGVIKEEKAWIDRTISLEQAFFRGKTSFCNATIMYRKTLLDKYLPLDDFINRQFTLQDWTAWMILSPYTDIDIIDASTATWCIETTSITRPKTYEQVLIRYNKELDCYKYCVEHSPNNLVLDEEGWMHYVNHQLLRVAYLRNDYRSAKKYAVGASRGMLEKMTFSWMSFQVYRLFKIVKSR